MNKKFLGLEQDLISVFEIWQGKRFISKNNQGNYVLVSRATRPLFAAEKQDASFACATYLFFPFFFPSRNRGCVNATTARRSWLVRNFSVRVIVSP